MARQLLPIAGAAIGFAVTGGNPAGARWGYLAGSLIGNVVDPIVVQGNKIGDNPAQTASEGGARAIVYGRGCITSTCLIARGDRKIKKKKSGGGKGGPKTVNEYVYWTFAIGLGEDLTGGQILRIWQDETLVYDVRPDGQKTAQENAAFAEKFRFYDGNESQLPDPALQSFLGADTPYFRGTAYIVFPQFDLTNTSERIPQFRFEVVTAQAALPSIGDEVTATYTMGGDYDSACIFHAASGNLGFAHSESGISIGESYTVGELDNTLSVVSTANHAWAGFSTGDSRLWIRGMNDSGLGISADDNYGYCGLFNASGELGWFQPSDTAGVNWWFGEGLWYPEYGGLVWFGEDALYLGVRATTFSGTYARRLIKFPLSAGSPTSSSAIVTDVGSASAPFFWMTRSRDGYIHLIGVDGEYWKYDADLSLVDNRMLGIAMAGFRGFGVDGDVFALVYGQTALTAHVEFRKTATLELVQSIYDSNMYGDQSTRVIFTDDSCYIQCRLWVGRVAYSRSVDSSKIPLSSIVSKLHQRCGHSGVDYDATALTEQVVGAVIEQTTIGAEAIASVVAPYFADPSDYDGCIHYIKRGAPVMRTMTDDDLLEEPETQQRENVIEYPRKLHFFYQSPTTGYAVTKATSSRSSPNVAVLGEASVSAPITYLDANEPAQIAAKWHKVMWAEAAGEIVWRVDDSNLDLVPGDCVGLSLRGNVRRARIVRTEYDPGAITLTMRDDRQSAYTSDVTGIPLPPPTPPSPSIMSKTVLAVLDIPALTDSADSLIYYTAMSGESEVWSGAQLQRSLDDGASFTALGDQTVNTVMGEITQEVTAASPDYTDTTNVVRVQLYDPNDEIDALTDAAWLSEQGALALESASGWELLQYRDAVDLGNGLYELSHLQRGRLNTEASDHSVGSIFVLLDASMMIWDAQSSWIGNDLTHRGVSFGTSPEDAEVVNTPYAGASQTEWPVANLLLDHAGNDLNIEVVQRHRFGTDMAPIRSLNWDGFRITASDGTNTAAVDTSSATHTFDVTGWASPITVTVAQLNRITGAGPTVSEEIA